MIKRMVRDLDFPVRIEVLPTVREADGLAMSSRNAYLEPADRRRAVALSRALAAAEQQALARDSLAAGLAAARIELAAPAIEPEYLEARDAETLEPVDRAERPTGPDRGRRPGRRRPPDRQRRDRAARDRRHESANGENRAEADAEVEDPPRDGDRLRRRLHRQHHDRHRADGRRRPARQRAGPRLGRRQRRPLRHLRDRGRARLGHDAGQRRRRPPGRARPQDHRRLLRRLRRGRPRALRAGRRPRRRRQPIRSQSTATRRCWSHELWGAVPTPPRRRRTRADDPAAPRRDEGERRTDRDGHRLRLPLGDGRRGGRRRHRPGRRLGRDGGARLPAAPSWSRWTR